MQASFDREFTGTSRFELRRRIGEGAVGVVYEAFDREHRAVVALKTLRTLGPEGLLSLKNEFRAVEDLRHPNLVRLGELLEADGTWFFTMELLHGLPLTTFTRQGDSLTRAAPANDAGPSAFERRVVSCFRQLAEGLSALHAAHKVHRDIKPSNVLVTEDERVVVLDFGVASDMLRQSGEEGMVGTAAYMAPEQAFGEAVGPEADWYAFGVVLYQALTGELPFTGRMDQVIEQKLSGQVRAPRALVPWLSPALEDLCLSLLAPEPANRPREHEIMAQLGSEAEAPRASLVQDGPFVGRDEELSLLEQTFAETRQSRGAMVVVEGESGVGKSSLLRRFIAGVLERHPNALVLAGRCYERESVPYKAFDGIVDQLGQLLAGMDDDEVRAILPPGAGLLVRAFPILELVPALNVPRSDEGVQNPQELRARVFAALRGLLTRLANARPLVLTIDDLQWADADSLALLEAVMRGPDEPRLMLLASQRVGTETGRMHGPTVPAFAKHVRLLALPYERAAELARRLLASTTDLRLADDEVRRLVEDAKGHPLFIDELVRLRATGLEGDLFRLDELLHQRVMRLEPAARRTLELLAVAGAPLTLDVAARAGSLDFAQLFDIVTGLRAEALVRMSGAARDSLVESYHDRIRESVAAHLSREARTAWHLRLASTFEQEEELDAEVVASHWAGAGRQERAAEYYARAADQSSSAMAFERAARLYERALACGNFGKEQTLALRMKRADALQNDGMLTAAAEARLELAKDADSHEADVQERTAAELFMCSGHYERGLALLRAALKKARVYHPGARIMVVLGMYFWRIWARVRGLSPRRERDAEHWGERLAEVDAVFSAGQAYAMNDNVLGAYFHARGLVSALSAGDGPRLSRTLGMAVCASSSSGLASSKLTEPMMRSLRALSNQLGTADARAYELGTAGFSAFNESRYHDAKPDLIAAEGMFRDQCLGVTYQLNTIRGILFRCLFALGDLVELRERVAPVKAQAERQGDRYMILICETAGGALLAAQHDDVADAERALAAARERLTEGPAFVPHYWAYSTEALINLYRGRPEEAYARMVWLEAALKRSLLWRVAPCRMQTTALRGRAAAQLALAGGAEAARHLRDAEKCARKLAREREPWGFPAARTILGLVALARGQRDRAIAAFRAAAHGFDGEHMKLYAAAARRLEGELRGGAEGDALVREADAVFAREDVVHPARMTRLFAGAVMPESAARTTENEHDSSAIARGAQRG